jgi:O-antigen ligase
MFFAILFIPIRNVTLKSYAWFSTALIMMFLCQSRTAMVGLAIIFLVYAVIHRKHLRTVLLTGLCALGSLFISYFITKVSISKSEIAEIAEQSQFEADSLRNLGLNPDSLHRSNQITYLESVVFGEGITGNSMKGRYEVWKHLWTMIKEKPVVGHAPHKEYFYENGLYPESEYVLMAWRYGFIGLFIYLALLFILARLAIKNLQGDFGLKLLLIVLVVAITGLTNNPFANKTILVLFAVVIGLGISEFRNRHSLTAESARKSEEDSNR